ncbi:MAG: polysaccharide deacetylase family protein [Prevotellaceae bacterium]|jgi:peptidoglycan/xylan/chitin deacetylase (PgdA/CDA1 family)|nr:polysaccharide deacetylase family protein [Prevotellaceae bacterium]
MNKKLFILIVASILTLTCRCKQKKEITKEFEYIHGGIVRGDKNEKKIALVFTSDGYDDGYETVRTTLKKHNAKGSFFFTGNAYRMSKFKTIVNTLKDDGHYLGAHSDKHLLYCSWEKRDSLLVTKSEYIEDVENNYIEMQKFGIAKTDAPYYIPPFEYYNDTISAWTRELDLQLVNFTAGTGSNADYTVPSMGEKYRDSKTIYNNILKYESEKPYGLNGFMLLIHFGVDAERTDKLYNLMDSLMTDLENKGYSFVSVKELLE